MIDANKLTIIPQSSVIEAWSKKGGADNWNLLKSSQNRTLEKTTYQISVVERNLCYRPLKKQNVMAASVTEILIRMDLQRPSPPFNYRGRKYLKIKKQKP
jgi:hypothetical protein